MKKRTTITTILAASLAAALFAGCATPDRQYSQTELNALQTREFDGTYDKVFDATIGALFDGGYVIQASDKRGGFLRAGRTSGGPQNTGSGGVQIKLDPAGHSRTSVRVSTIGSGQSRVEKTRIDELMLLIDQKLLTASGGSQPK
jgi:hypothetical protein